MPLSSAQQSFVDKCVGGQNVIASATAGAGKSYTITQAVNAIVAEKPSAKGVAVTFSKPLADELNKKLDSENFRGQTIHSLCYGTVAKALKASGCKRKLTVQESKYRQIFKAYDIYGDEATGWLDELETLQKLSLPLQSISNLMRTKFAPDDAELLVNVLNDGLNQFYDDGILTYNDMVWYPVLLELGQHAFKHKHLFLDETQDVSPLYLDAILMHTFGVNATQVASVGDPFQTIHGWNGISIKRFEEIKLQLASQQVRFNETYRLPQSVVSLLHQLNLTTDIVTNKRDVGAVLNTSYESMLDALKPGDMVLSRFHASPKPDSISLTKLGIDLIKSGRAIRYVRFDPLAHVVSFCHYAKTKRKGKSLLVALNAWRMELENIARRTAGRDASEQQIAERMDNSLAKAESVMLHLPMYSGNDVSEFEKVVRDFYGRNKSENAVLLSSIHSAKGLEADNVFILNPQQLMTFHKAPTEEQYVGEANVMFVGLSRAKQTLNFVGDTPEPVDAIYPTFYQ